MSDNSGEVLVIGAGVCGLTTAVCLVEDGSSVRIWAREGPTRTTSMVASAMWGPSFLEPVAKTLAWSEASLRTFGELADDPGSGVRMAASLIVGGPPLHGPLPPQLRLVPDLRPCAPEQLPPAFASGFQATMPLIDMPVYLEYLSERFTSAGGTIEARTVASLEEATKASPRVVNCSGLGARELAGDITVRPVRGQHVIVSNPGLTDPFLEMSAQPEWTGIWPHPDRIVCGGSQEPDSWDLDEDEALSERILARCRAVEPRLDQAQVIDVMVGLRPVRPSIRVDAEHVRDGLLVHNYGHGGEGVSLSWGCAREAANLVSR
jgi:D-amino-acid oxidase